MTGLNKDYKHIEKLADIGECCGIDYLILQKQFANKARDYTLREGNEPHMTEQPHYDRAMDVIIGYYTRKHLYTESWIE